MTLRVIINPASRDGTCGERWWPRIRAILERYDTRIIEHRTRHAGDGPELARDLSLQLERAGPEAWILCCGGDGLIHAVASGLRGSSVRLALLPCGTGNDLARTHGIPSIATDKVEELERAVEIAFNGRDRLCPAFRVEGFPLPRQDGFPSPAVTEWDGDPRRSGRVVRWAFVECDGGITGAISRAKLTRARRLQGSLKYTWLGLTTIPRWPARMVSVRFDGEEPEVMGLTMCAATTGETFGGGYRVCPGMHPFAPEARVVLAPRMSRLQMFRLMKPLRAGDHVGRWGIALRPCTSFEVSPLRAGAPSEIPVEGQPIVINVDGEPELEAPVSVEWFRDQLWIRGAQEVPWDRLRTPSSPPA